MAGVKLGDRFLAVGVRDTKLIAALAAKAGLTGTACAVDADAARPRSRGAAIERDGALAETSRTRRGARGLRRGSFDVARDRDLLPTLTPDERIAVPWKSCASSARRPRDRRSTARAAASARSWPPADRRRLSAAARVAGAQGRRLRRGARARRGRRVSYVEGIKKATPERHARVLGQLRARPSALEPTRAGQMPAAVDRDRLPSDPARAYLTRGTRSGPRSLPAPRPGRAGASPSSARETRRSSLR